MSLSSHPQDTAVTTTMVTSIPLQTEEIPLETHSSITTSADFSTIISNRGIIDQNQIQVLVCDVEILGENSILGFGKI